MITSTNPFSASLRAESIRGANRVFVPKHLMGMGENLTARKRVWLRQCGRERSRVENETELILLKLL